jgi:hypothetical protein
VRHILAGEPLAGFSTVVFLFVHARLVNQHLARTTPPSPSRSSRPMAGACVCGKFNFGQDPDPVHCRLEQQVTLKRPARAPRAVQHAGDAYAGHCGSGSFWNSSKLRLRMASRIHPSRKQLSLRRAARQGGLS